jgi:hypothetical protein
VDYFCAIKIGLTATPRDHIEHDTFKLFDCDQHDPTFAYTYEEAVYGMITRAGIKEILAHVEKTLATPVSQRGSQAS